MPDALDPQATALCHRPAGFLFPWDITRALELALLKTFCLSSISGLLSSTGEFEQRPRKRYGWRPLTTKGQQALFRF